MAFARSTHSLTERSSPFAVSFLVEPGQEVSMTHHVLMGAIAALAVAGSTAAQAQVYVEEPGVVVRPSPYVSQGYVTVAPSPYVTVAPRTTYVAPTYGPTYVAPGYDYGYGAPQPYVTAPTVADNYTTVNPYTGRRCTTYPDGHQWCWTP
jgi:hypothetical protein